MCVVPRRLTKRKKMAGTQVMIKTRQLPQLQVPRALRDVKGLMSPMSRHSHESKDFRIVLQPRRVQLLRQREVTELLNRRSSQSMPPLWLLQSV